MEKKEKKSNVPVKKKEKREKYTQGRAHMFSSLSLLSFKIKESHDAKKSNQKYLELGFPSIPQTISTHLHNLNQGVRLVSPGGPVFDFTTYVLQVSHLLHLPKNQDKAFRGRKIIRRHQSSMPW